LSPCNQRLISRHRLISRILFFHLVHHSVFRRVFHPVGFVHHAVCRIASRIFDIWVMLGFGLLGFALRLMHYPIAPLVLGIVLGEMLDRNFRRAMVLSDGALEPLVTRPICAVLATLTLLVLVWDLPPLARVRASLLARFR